MQMTAKYPIVSSE